MEDLSDSFSSSALDPVQPKPSGLPLVAVLNFVTSAIYCAVYCAGGLVVIGIGEYMRRRKRFEFRTYHIGNFYFRFNFSYGTLVCTAATLLFRGVSFIQYVGISKYHWYLHILFHLTHGSTVTLYTFLFCVWLHHFRSLEQSAKFIKGYHRGLIIANVVIYVMIVICFIHDLHVGSNTSISMYKFAYMIVILLTFMAGTLVINYFAKHVLPERDEDTGITDIWRIQQNERVAIVMKKTTISSAIIIFVNLVIIYILAFTKISQMFNLAMAILEKATELGKFFIVAFAIKNSSKAFDVAERTRPLLDEEFEIDNL